MSSPTNYVRPNLQFSLYINIEGRDFSRLEDEKWFVYMAAYGSPEARARLQSADEVSRAFDTLTKATVKAHSDIQVMVRTTSKICVKSKTHSYSLDPDDCHVGMMGSGDIWAENYGQRPQPCLTDYNIVSQLPPKTCQAVGGRQTDGRPVAAPP